MQAKIISGAAEIKKAIASIANRGAKLDGDIQSAALSVLAHIEQHGDTTLADALVNAMPKSGRKLALVEAMVGCGMIRVLGKEELTEEDKLHARVFALDRTKATNLDALQAKPWYEWRKEAPVAVAFDIQKSTTTLLTRIKAAAMKQGGLTGVAEARKNLEAMLALLPAEDDE